MSRNLQRKNGYSVLVARGKLGEKGCFLVLSRGEDSDCGTMDGGGMKGEECVDGSKNAAELIVRPTIKNTSRKERVGSKQRAPIFFEQNTPVLAKDTQHHSP